MFKIINRDTKKRRLAKEGAVANTAERQQKKLNKKGTKKANIATRAVQQTKINRKYNKNITLITSLSGLYIWEQHEVPEIK